MELKQVRCTTCGFPMSIDITEKQHTCGACVNSFISNIAQKLSENQSADIDVLKNSRINLDRSITSNDLNAILHFTNTILGMIPEDFTGLYYNAYAASKLTNPKALHGFLKKGDYEATDEDIQNVVHHIAKYSDLRDRKVVFEFVENIAPWLLDTVKETFETRIQKENDYAVVKRDVFICHRSTDKDEALKVVETLEADGHTCWISYRNLRPDDNENYWKNIEQAIKHCDIFLVVSSQDAMLSKDVQKEIQMASERKMKRMEYKIDNSIHTTLFKHFFSGLKWINAMHHDGLEELKLRIYDLQHVKSLSESKKIQSTEPEAPVHYTNTEGLIKRAYFEVSMGKYDLAQELVENIFNIDIENEDAWVIKLLIAEKERTLDSLYEKLRQASLDYFESLTRSEAYQALAGFKSSHEVIDKIHEYNALAEERHIVYIKNQKDEALRNTDWKLLERLAKEYPEPVKDVLYPRLADLSIHSLAEFKETCMNCENPKNVDVLQGLFHHPDIRSNLDHEMIQPYYELFNKSRKSYEEHLAKQARLKEEEKARLIEEMETLIANKDFSEASELLNYHHELLNASSNRHFWELCIKYKVSSIDELTEVCSSIEDKKKLINDDLILMKKLPSEERNLINPIVDQFTQEVNEHNKKQLELRIERRMQKRKWIFKRLKITVVAIGLLTAITLTASTFVSHHQRLNTSADLIADYLMDNNMENGYNIVGAFYHAKESHDEYIFVHFRFDNEDHFLRFDLNNDTSGETIEDSLYVIYLNRRQFYQFRTYNMFNPSQLARKVSERIME